MKPKVLLALRADLFNTMFSSRDMQRLHDLADVMAPAPPVSVDTEFLRNNIGGAEIAITSWGTPAFDEEILQRADSLQFVAHAGGSVRPIVTSAFWEKKLRITSAAAAISRGVSEYCLGLILTATKRAFWLGLETRNGHWTDAGNLFGGWHEIYQQKIGIIGAGYVGRHLASLLSNFTCDILIYDPYLSDETAHELNATKVETLDELFEQCDVVSLNAPSTPETTGMLRGHHFAKLRRGSLFINTARSSLINEQEFLAELKKGHFVACIDVTDIEPPPLDYPMRHLPNVWLTPHLAGTVAENKLRIGTMVVDEIEAYTQNKSLIVEVTEEKLKTLA
jgi:phosphoglycerate dehydrogenase-like enzyme